MPDADLDAAIRERLDDPKPFLENGIEPLIRAILTVLNVHRPVHTKGSGVNTAGWDDCASWIGRALQYELAGIDTSALARDLFALEKLVRDRTAAIYRLGQDLLRQAIEAEKARRTTDEAWQRELERREQIKAYLGGRWRNAGARA